MVIILDCNSGINAHVVWSEIGNLIWLRHVFKSRAVANLNFSCKYLFSLTHAQCTLELPSNISTIPTFIYPEASKLCVE